MKIVILCPYPYGSAGSQRFRFEQYLFLLKQNGQEVIQLPFLSTAGWKILYKPGHIFNKIYHVLAGFVRRAFSVPALYRADYILIHREAAPVGPPAVEWLIASIFKKKIIFDFDDSIWLFNTSDNNRISSFFKFHHKTNFTLRHAYKISAGNAYLAAYATGYNKNVIINPTTIDTDYHRPASQSNSIPVIGWTGTHSTLRYLPPVFSALKKLAAEYRFKFVVICNEKPTIEGLAFEYIPWNNDTEIEDLATFDIGLMPLYNDVWSQGKCGFKALQYMALEIPVLLSPVGVNTEIVTHGTEGFHCTEENDWYRYLQLLLNDAELRKTMGAAGRKKVIEKYSVTSNSGNFLSLFS